MPAKTAKKCKRSIYDCLLVNVACSVGAALTTAPQDVATGEALDAFVTQQGNKLADAICYRASFSMANFSMTDGIFYKFNRASLTTIQQRKPNITPTLIKQTVKNATYVTEVL